LFDGKCDLIIVPAAVWSYGKSLDWDGEKMWARDAPEATRFIHTTYRTKWLA
jgi:hypothetical protein